jgi:hypothetical protein
MKDMHMETLVVNIRAARASSARSRAHRRMRTLAAAARTAAAAAAADPDAVHPLPEEPPRGGRAWLNGTELGGYDRRYAHLTRAYE